MAAVVNGDQSKEQLRVLVTGFGPFYSVVDNPSWRAAAPLHNTIIHTPSHPLHVTALGPIKVAYQSVLCVVPRLYARPPVLPPQSSAHGGLVPEPAAAHPPPGLPYLPPPPADGYDFIFHLGLGQAGSLSIEQVGHKSGYQLKDVDGELAPVIEDRAPVPPSSSSLAQQAEVARLGVDADELDPKNDTYVLRGFTENYERFPENMHTEIDVDDVIEHLKLQGETRVRASTDAGHFLCEFITYCSLAESQRALFYPEEADGGGRSAMLRSKCLFMHVPPEDTPHSIAEMTEAVRQIIAWVCTKEKALPL